MAAKRKTRAKSIKDSGNTTPDPETQEIKDDGKDSEKCKIDWEADDHNLSKSLVNAIMDDPDIKEGLYPSPGGNMSTLKSGGNKKTVWQYKLACVIFEGHPTYGSSFSHTVNCTSKALAAKRQAVWGAKVKNRLVRMGKITRDFIAVLGATGEGIERAEDVDLSLNNSFVNKWKQITTECPWFIDMRSLIAERPNMVTVGIGNSATEIDIEALPGAGLVEIPDDFTSEPDYTILDDDLAREIVGSDTDEPDALDNADGEKEMVSHGSTKKRKFPLSDTEDIKPKRDTPARPGKSKPLATAPQKRTRLDELNTAAAAEEVTHQREIDLSKAKVEASAKVKQRLIDARAETQLQAQSAAQKDKSEKRQIQKEIRLQNMEHKHQRRMERMRLQAQIQLGHAGTSTALGFTAIAPPNSTDDFLLQTNMQPQHANFGEYFDQEAALGLGLDMQ